MIKSAAFITGAGIGIGAACMEAFAREGYRVVGTDVSPGAGNDLAEKLRGEGFDVEFYELDVTDRGSVVDVVHQTEGEGFSAVVANAGIALRKPFDEMDEGAWDQTLDVNLGGTMRVFKAALPEMVRRGGGSLISLSSISGVAYGWGEHAHYSTSKSAVIGLTRALAVEYGHRNVRANSIAPGFIRTAQSLSAVHSMGEEGLQAAVSSIPLGRVGEPADVADVATFLASDAARYITGQVITVDGGLLVKQG